MLSSGSGLEGELLGMGMWSLGLGAVGAALAGIFLANTDLCLPKADKAQLEYLEETELRSTVDGRLALWISLFFLTPAAVKPIRIGINITSAGIGH